MDAIITISVTPSTISGFNNLGQRMDARHNAANSWNVGPDGQTAHDTRTHEFLTKLAALEYIARKLANV